MADINIKVGLQGAAEVKAQMGYIQAAANSFADKLTNKFVSTFSAVAVGAMAFDKLLESVNKNISAAKQITSLSTKFHLDPKAVHSMMIAANNAGVAIRTLLQGMKQLTKYADGAMSKGGGSRSLMKQLFGMDANGKEIQDLDAKIQEISKSPAKFLPEVAMALAKINNEQDKTKMGTQLLGRQYQQLIPLLEQLAESEEARNNFLNNGSAMSAEQIEQAKKLGAATSDLQNAWDKFAASLFPVLTFLLNGLSLLSSWVQQIKIIGQTWRNEVTQENAKVNEKIVRYEGGLRKRASSGNLTDEEKADLKKASDGGMTQEEWINKRVKGFSQREWAKEREKNQGGSDMVLGAAMILGGALLTATGVGAGVGIYMGGAGAAIMGASAIDTEMKNSETNEAEKAQQAAYDAEIEKRKKMITKATEEQKKKNIENANAKLIERLTGQKSNDRVKKHQREIQEDYGFSSDNPAAKAELQKRLAADSVYQEETKQIQADYLADMNNAGNVQLDNDTPIGQAYNLIQNKKATMSEEELSKEMMRLGLQEKDAIAALGSAIGGDFYFDRKTLTYRKGKKPKDTLPTLKTTKLKNEDEDKKRQAAKDKMKKARTRGERQEALAEMRANEATTPQEEAVITGEMNITNAKEDIAEATPKIEETKVAREEADKLLEKRRAEEVTAIQEVTKLDNVVENLTSSDKKDEEYMAGLAKRIEDANAKVEDATAKAKSAEVSATLAAQKEQEAIMNGSKARTDLDNALREHAKAVEQLWLHERNLAEQKRKDEEDWEDHITQLKYKNMKKLGYSQTQIAEEAFLDAQEKFEEAVKREQEAKIQVEENLKKRRAEAGLKAHLEGADELGVNLAMAGVKTNEAEDNVLKDVTKDKRNAQKGVDAAMENWEKIKPRMVVSELGRVGGGSAFQMGGSGPTDLLKEQVKLQRQLVKNTTKEPKVDKDKGSLTWGNKAVWGKKQPINR
jgi:hypothetical protein